MSRAYPPAARITFYIIKFIAISSGIVLSLVCAMSMVGALFESGWLRFFLALLLILVPPLFLTDRLLPEDPSSSAPGLVSDVLSLFWVGLPVLWVLALGNISKPLLAREGDRLHSADHPQLAELAYLMAAVNPQLPPSEVPPVGSASASALPSASSAPSTSVPTSGSVAPPASASAPASASVVQPSPDAGAPTGEKTPAQLFKELAPSVVTIFVKGDPAGMESSGTGFLIDDKGTIATNHHVIENGKSIQIRFHNGALFDTADLLVDSPAIDLALLAIDIEHPADAGPQVGASALALGDSDTVVVGERAISIGNPLGLEHTLTDGLVSARRMYEGRAWIQMSVPVSPGNSGGPLFNMRGEVIGITTRQVLGGMFNRAQNLNLAVPVNELKKFVSTSYPSRRKFGNPNKGEGHWLPMRQLIITSLTFAGLVALGATFAIRTRTPHAIAPVVSAPVPASASSSKPVASASASATFVPSSSSSGASSAPVGSGSSAPSDAPPKQDRALQVVVYGWELAVPMVAANHGLDPSPQSEFSKAGVSVKVGVTDRLSMIENALARGGQDRDGADIAVLPLPSFVAAYERLRALNPEIFYVVGWSRGRDALMGSKELLSIPPVGETTIAGNDGTAPLFLGLWAMDLAGYSSTNLKLLPSSKAAEAQNSAQDRTSPFEGAHRLTLLSTADASRLIPYVAVAQRSLIERQTAALGSWARGWIAGQRIIESDPAEAARHVGAVQGAPGPLPLLKGLGEMQSSSLPDAIRAAGLSGRSAVTLDTLFQQSWQLWRAYGALSTPAPDTVPVSTVVLTNLARSEVIPPPRETSPRIGSEKGKPLLVYRQKEGAVDEKVLESKLALLASIFERSMLRVSMKQEGGKLKKMIENIQGTYDLAPGRIVIGTKLPERAAAAIEVFPAP